MVLVFQLFKDKIIQLYPQINNIFLTLAGAYPSDGGMYGYTYGSITADNYRELESYFPIVALSLLFAGIVGLCFYYCIKDKDAVMFFCGLILSAGFASRCVMCFSPTIWASDKRTFMPFYLCIIFCIYLLLAHKKNRNGKLETTGTAVIYLVGVVSYMASVMKLY